MNEDTAITEMQKSYQAWVDSHVAKDYIPSAELTSWGKLFVTGTEGMMYGQQINEPLDPYAQSLWVNRCVTAIHTAVVGTPIRLTRAALERQFSSKSYQVRFGRMAQSRLKAMDGRRGLVVGKEQEGEIVEQGPAFDLLAQPNHYQDWPAFISSIVGYFKLRGSVAAVNTNEAPYGNEWHPIDGKYIKPRFEHDAQGLPFLIGYIYKPKHSGIEIPFLPEEVRYWHTWSDKDPFTGQSPIEPARYSIATDFSASQFNASALANHGEPGIIYIFPQGIDAEQKKDFYEQVRQRCQGPTRSMRSLVVGGDLKIESPGRSFPDLQFDEGKTRCALEICCNFGVPPVVAGWVQASGEATAYIAEMRRLFYEATIFPLLETLLPGIQYMVAQVEANAVVFWHVEELPIIQAARLSRTAQAKDFAAMGYPVNMINDRLDMGMPELSWGDEGTLAQGLVPADLLMSGGDLPAIDEGPTPAPDDIPPDEPGNQVGERGLRQMAATAAQEGRAMQKAWEAAVGEKSFLDAVWQAWARSWNPIAEGFGRTLRQRCLVQERQVIAALKRELPEVKTLDSGRGPVVTKDDGIISRVLLTVFGNVEDKKAWRARVRVFAQDAQELGLRQALAESGLAGEELDEAVQRILSNPAIVHTLNSDVILVSTKIDDGTRRILKDNISAGLRAAEGVNKIADRVQAAMGNRRAAAVATTRNAIGQVMSASRHEAALTWATHKKWVHSRGRGIRRPEHIAAETFYAANPIPIEQPFIVGGVPLMYPRDFSTGNYSETMNCQCLDVYMRLATEGKADGLAAVRARDFYSREKMIAARAKKN